MRPPGFWCRWWDSNLFYKPPNRLNLKGSSLSMCKSVCNFVPESLLLLRRCNKILPAPQSHPSLPNTRTYSSSRFTVSYSVPSR